MQLQVGLNQPQTLGPVLVYRPGLVARSNQAAASPSNRYLKIVSRAPPGRTSIARPPPSVRHARPVPGMRPDRARARPAPQQRGQGLNKR
ncbi:hypothetical protein NDU88_008009 [Pleurodeles waltl]|uniref:Uncharacterized protein n=1 Tax=Pleurodeles waltl TaxID=8319 RepID=A0AAV7PV24_PLEWA|nr:hypothetical protein NDU88_008009 [Pleurodeles waltl]